MKILVLLAAALVSSANCNLNMSHWSISRGQIDSDTVEVLLRKFLVNQESITIFSVYKSSELLGIKRVYLKILASIAPLIIYDRIDEALVEKIHDMGTEISLPSTTKAYFALSPSASLITQHLKFFSGINTNGKWVFAMRAVDQTEVDKVLQTAWTEHKMVNVLILFWDSNSKMFVKSYNPFVRMNRFWTFEVLHENLDVILTKVENVFEKKVTNLRDYNFRATKFLDGFVHNNINDQEIMFIFEKVLKTKFILVPVRDAAGRGVRLPNNTFTGEIAV